MKVLLVALPSPFIEETMGPPLGLCYLGAELKRLGHEVKAVDLAVDSWSLVVDADFCGIYCVSAQHKWLKRCIGSIRRVRPEARIVVGGPHATAEPIACFEAGADYVVRGEGEVPMRMLLEQMGEHLIPGLCYIDKERGPIIKEPVYIHSEVLKHFPLPDYSIFDMSKYKRKVAGNTGFHIITLRGCPYSCHFCDSKMVGHTVRYLPPERVFENIDHIIKVYGVKSFVIYDDIFTLKKSRVRELCKGFKARGIRWRCWVRSDLLDEESLVLMKDAGLESIAMGIESGSDKILKNINKKATVEDNRKAIMLCKKHNVPVRCSLMFGNPGETIDTLENTIDFISVTQPDEWNLSVLMPSPGSEFWVNPENHGLKLNKQAIRDNDYRDLHRCGESNIGSMVFEVETLRRYDIKTLLKWFVRSLEAVCPRKKIRDTIQDIQV